MKVDLNEKDNDGWTGFHLACKKGQSRVIELILEKSTIYKVSNLVYVSIYKY